MESNNNNSPIKKTIKKPTKKSGRKDRKEQKGRKIQRAPKIPVARTNDKGKEEASSDESSFSSSDEMDLSDEIVVPRTPLQKPPKKQVKFQKEPEMVEIPSPSKGPALNIQKIAQSITNKVALIFCRVSSIGQTGFGHVSFEVQEAKGVACAMLFKLKVMTVIKIVESAYNLKKNQKPTIETMIGKYSGKNIIIYNVSRFSRSEREGKRLLDYAIKRNTRLFFVDEGLIWDRNNQHNRQAILHRLMLSQEESRAISSRVSAALFLRKQQGFHIGGKPKYGYKVVEADGGKKAVADQYEQAVITFINMCRQVGTTLRAINQWMEQLTDDFEPIELGHNQRSIVEPLTYQNIADLLNDYGVLRRGSRWTGASVSEIAKRDYENVLENLVQLTMKTGFN